MDHSVPLTLTKLRPPVVRPTAVHRERLNNLMQAAPAHRAILLCAAPGYGKTTLLAGAVAGLPCPQMWYSLNRADRDAITFLTHLVAGISQQYPAFDQAVRATLTPGSSSANEWDTCLAVLVNQLCDLVEDDFVIVLDDFHLVAKSGEVRYVVDQLLHLSPPNIHFVIAGRSRPALPHLPGLLATGQCLEVDQEDLRFTPAEAAALFSSEFGLHLSEDQVERLVQQTEGWALGLLSIGQSLVANPQLLSGDFLASLESQRRILFDYLTQEVLRQQPPPVRDFLIETAILSYLDVPVCNHLLKRNDSGEMLRYLEDHNLFIVRMSDGSLRYHRVFRDFLLQQARARPGGMRERQRQAATYFEAQSNWERAIHHYVEAEDYMSAAALVSRVSHQWVRSSRFDTFSFWVSCLPDAVLDRFPALLLQQGRVYEARGRLDQALAWYDRAARVYSEHGDHLGLSDALRSKGHILDWRKGRHEEAARIHRQALSYVGDDSSTQRAALLRSLSRDQLSAGHTQVALQLYREALTIYEENHDPEGQLLTLLNPGSWLFHSLGDFAQALMVLYRAEQLAKRLGSQHHLAECYNNLSVNLYFLWRAEEALAAAEQALQLSRHVGDVHNEAFALMNLANARSALGVAGYSALRREYEQTLLMEQAEGDRRFMIANLVFLSILARRHGDYGDAIARAQQALALARDRGLAWLSAWALVNQGAAQVLGDPSRAYDSLNQGLELMQRSDDRYHIAMAHLWLAHLANVDYHPTADQRLRACLAVAVEAQLDHLFRCEAEIAAPLLVQALEKKLWPAYAAQVLGKLGQLGVDQLLALHRHLDAEVRRHAIAALVHVEDARVIRELARFAHAGDPEVRAAARGVIHRLNARVLPPLTFQCFGPLRVIRGDAPVSDSAWRGQRARRLLRYLLINPEYAMVRDQVMDQMWPNLDSDAASRNLYRVVYDLRCALHPGNVSRTSGYVRLEGELIRLNADLIAEVDVTAFCTSVTSGLRAVRQGNLQEARAALQQAVDLYADDLFTDDLYDDWLAPKRCDLRQQLATAAHTLSRILADAGDFEGAILLLQRVLTCDPTDEQACFDVMVCLARAGRRAEALQQFAACKTALNDLRLKPSSWLQELYYHLASSSDLSAVPTLSPLPREDSLKS